MGSAYATIFWIQNLGLMAFPMIIGWVLNKVNPGVGEAIKAGEHVSYNYTVPMLIFASLGVLAFLLAFWLKLEDRKKALRPGTAQHQEITIIRIPGLPEK